MQQPEFVIYDLTTGLTSTELKDWLIRWLMSHLVNNTTTVLAWEERAGIHE
jgi:hypothetical protein